MTHFAATEEEMMDLARQCASGATPGGIWWLNGDLGAGKTHWTKGFVAGLGSTAVVTSPTFGLLHEYTDGSIPVFHFDFYRLNSPEELLAMGWDEILERQGIVIVEWGERFPELMPKEAHQVTIITLEDGRRQVTMT